MCSLPRGRCLSLSLPRKMPPRPSWAQGLGNPIARALYLVPLVVFRTFVLWLWEQVCMQVAAVVCWKGLGEEGGEHSGFRVTLAEPRKCRRGRHECSRHALVRSTSKEISFFSVSAPPPPPLPHSLSVRRRMSSPLPRRDPGWKQKPSWLA